MLSTAPRESKEAQIARVTRRYELDRASGRQARSIDDIPIKYESITPEWLTAVLCRAVAGAKVLDFTLGSHDDGTSGRRRIFIEYNEEGRAAGLPKSVFGKSSQELVHRLSYQLCGSTHAETNFYEVVRPLLHIEAPECLYARSDSESCNSLVLLRDLGEQVDFCDEHTLLSRDEARDAVALLANLHATCGRAETFARIRPHFETWPERWRRLVEINEMEHYTNQGFRRAHANIPERLSARYQEVWPRTMDSVLQHERLPHTFNHGDTHLANWYRTRQGRMGLADWQGCCVGHWSRDLIFAISTMLTVEQRRAWDRELVAEYLSRAQELGAPRVELEQAWTWCRQQSLSALAYWTVTYTPSPGMPADMQPPVRTLALITRLAAAVDDLDALDSFP